jgi:hypothetical protein
VRVIRGAVNVVSAVEDGEDGGCLLEFLCWASGLVHSGKLCFFLLIFFPVVALASDVMEIRGCLHMEAWSLGVVRDGPC